MQERPDTWHPEPSGPWRHPALPEKVTSPKQTTAADEKYNDYPQIDGPRSFNRRSMVPYTPRPNLPDPQHIGIHKPVTSYAGQGLYALCPSVPYILGPLALVTQLQLIVETPILLPDEVIILAEARGVDTTTLGSYDLAMLNILGCLWNDWDPMPYEKLSWLTTNTAVRFKHEGKHREYRLELYFLRRDAIVHRRNVNILEFIIHMRRWRLFPNPARVIDFNGDDIS